MQAVKARSEENPSSKGKRRKRFSQWR